MYTINLKDAKSGFSSLVDQVIKGDHNNHPSWQTLRSIGLCRGSGDRTQGNGKKAFGACSLP